MREQYARIVNELAPRVDLLLAETLCHSSEARAALHAAAPSGKPCWLALTLHDDVVGPPTLRGGEAVPDAISALRGGPMPAALLFNCCAPQVVSSALRAMPCPPGVERLGGYANGFRSTTSQWLFESGAAELGCSPARHHFAACATCAAQYDPDGLITPRAYADHAEAWVREGAAVVGGCCGVGPLHMAAVSERLASLSVALSAERSVC